MDAPLVRMEAIDKAYPGVQALTDCRFELYPGEVHALVGENGAGKSTLVKILTGVVKRDAGTIFYKGAPVEISSPRAAQELGISIIHQEFNLMPHLTVAQNVFVGREPRGRLGIVDDDEANRRTRELLQMVNLDLDPRRRVADLTVANQQLVEIIKALSFNAEVLIMDEPTAALTESEIEDLFRIIRNLRDRGVGIIHISHRMDELQQISDRVTVLRDGQYVDTVRIQEAGIGAIIRMMVGRELYETLEPKPETAGSEVALEVRGLHRPPVRNVSFHLRRGEILGFAGLMGAGRTEVARAIFGADPIESGEIMVNGRRAVIRSPEEAVRHGIGYLSEDRKRYGVTLGMDVMDNLAMASFHKFLGTLGTVRSSQVREAAQTVAAQLQIKTPSLRQRVKNLSGGNQQKVVIGKWLIRDCDILIFDEPTRGIDVGAKSEIYRLLNDLAAAGKSIIMISSELPEILRMSHRIIVMCEGQITGELNAEEATQERIMHYATLREEVAAT